MWEDDGVAKLDDVEEKKRRSRSEKQVIDYVGTADFSDIQTREQKENVLILDTNRSFWGATQAAHTTTV